MKSPWDLVASEQFEAAARAYTAKLKEQETAPDFYNRAIAYLNLKNYAKALRDLNEAERVRMEEPWIAENNALSDGYRLAIGTVHWVSGNEIKAMAVWDTVLIDHEERKIVYTDAAGGVESPSLAWFAAKTLSNSELVKRAEKFLKRTLRNKQSTAWPGAIGALILNKITESDLFVAASRSEPLKNRRLCQAWFWAGVKASQEGDLAQAKELFIDAAASKAFLEEEMYLAAAEFAKVPKRK